MMNKKLMKSLGNMGALVFISSFTYLVVFAIPGVLNASFFEEAKDADSSNEVVDCERLSKHRESDIALYDLTVVSFEAQTRYRFKQCRKEIESAREVLCKYYVDDLLSDALDTESSRASPRPRASTVEYCKDEMKRAASEALKEIVDIEFNESSIVKLSKYNLSISASSITQVSDVLSWSYSAYPAFSIKTFDDSYFVIRFSDLELAKEAHRTLLEKMKTTDQ